MTFLQEKETINKGMGLQLFSVILLRPNHFTPWVQFSSVAQSCPTLCQASLSITISRSSLRLNVHRVRDAIQPSHPGSSPSPPAPNLSQHHNISKPGHVRILSIVTQPVTMFFKFLFHKSCILFNKSHCK